MITRNTIVHVPFGALLGLGALLVGCSGIADKPDIRMANDVGSMRGSGSQYAGPRPDIDAADLDSVAFSLVGLGVGLGDNPKGQVPIISYLLPNLADFAQVLRCRDDADLGDLLQIDIGQTDPAKALDRFIRVDYWDLAIRNPFCKVISESFSRPGQVSFVDKDADSGSHRYLVRACASASRIRGSGSYESPKECSAWVGVSPALVNFKRGNAVLPASTVEDLRTVADRADALGRKIHLLAQRLDAETKACEERAQREKLAAAMRPIGLAEVLSFGMDLGRDLIEVNDPYSTTADVLNSINPTQVSTALKNVFSDPQEFSKTCTAAERARAEGEALRVELELLRKQHKELNVEGGAGEDHAK
jgi:hypothetical protein